MIQPFVQKLRSSLARTRESFFNSFATILPFGSRITEDVLDDVETVLYGADIGVATVEKLIEELRRQANNINSGEADPFSVMKETVLSVIDRPGLSTTLQIPDRKPIVLLVIGVNGTGKTTTIGKLATRFRRDGKTVLLAACDTFRAAAIEQLEIWAERSGSEFIKAHIDADAASVAYDAVSRAQARGTDIVIIDTAGRLHTSFNLMSELKKIKRVLTKADETAPHETLLVIDATNGQNALRQAETFLRELEVTGIVLTKLDGTAKGGIAVSIIEKLGIPIKLIGIGEGLDDLRDFDPKVYAEALFSFDR